MDFPCADKSCIVFTVLLLIMAASWVHAQLMLHSLQPSHGAVNFILAQLYVGVNTIAQQPNSTWQVPGMMVLVVIGGTCLFGLGLAARAALKSAPLRHIREQAELAQWQKAMNRWHQLFYCHRCGGVFAPGQTQLASHHALYMMLSQP